MIITLTGPTCSGKSSVEQELLHRGMARVISHTTRQPRGGEVDGQHYNFVTKERFLDLKKADAFVETNQLGSNFYAKSYSALITAIGRASSVVMVLDPNGAHAVRSFAKSKGIGVISCWLDCSVDVQAARFAKRVQDSGDSDAVSERLAIMLGEEAKWRLTFPFFSAEKIFDTGSSSSQKVADQIIEAIPALSPVGLT
jgi:guanylate kinase